MNWKTQLLSELDRFMSPAYHRSSLAVPVPCGHLVADVQTADALACSIQRLALQSPRLAQASSDQLRNIAAHLSGRLCYLLEPIQTIEADQEACVVQMRSQPPHHDEEGTKYYEVLASRGGEISLMRYQKVPRETRHTILAIFTREVLCRLAQDLSDAVP